MFKETEVAKCDSQCTEANARSRVSHLDSKNFVLFLVRRRSTILICSNKVLSSVLYTAWPYKKSPFQRGQILGKRRKQLMRFEISVIAKEPSNTLLKNLGGHQLR